MNGQNEPTIDACILCGSRSFDRPYPTKLPWLATCSVCSLRFVNPQPGDAELAMIYTSEYFDTFGYSEQRDAAYRQMKQATADRLLRLAERHVKVGTLLDVGSGLGDLLAVATRRGWAVRGVEPNRYACDLCDRIAPGVAFCGTLAEFGALEEPFDLITCTEVLEHLRRPDEALAQMYRLLKPRGALLLTVPDAGCLASRVQRYRWWHYHRDHLWYFSRRTVAQLLGREGFQLRVCCRARKVFNLLYIFSVLGAYQRNRWLRMATGFGVRHLPERLLSRPLPPLAEGLAALALRPPVLAGMYARSAPPPASVQKPEPAASTMCTCRPAISEKG